MPVRRLQYLEGDSRDTESSLLIFGGQVLDQPDSLSLASLDNLAQASPQPPPHRPSAAPVALPAPNFAVLDGGHRCAASWNLGQCAVLRDLRRTVLKGLGAGGLELGSSQRHITAS